MIGIPYRTEEERIYDQFKFIEEDPFDAREILDEEGK